MYCIRIILIAHDLHPFATHIRLQPLLLPQCLRPCAILVLVPPITHSGHCVLYTRRQTITCTHFNHNVDNAKETQSQIILIYHIFIDFLQVKVSTLWFTTVHTCTYVVHRIKLCIELLLNALSLPLSNNKRRSLTGQ